MRIEDRRKLAEARCRDSAVAPETMPLSRFVAGHALTPYPHDFARGEG